MKPYNTCCYTAVIYDTIRAKYLGPIPAEKTEYQDSVRIQYLLNEDITKKVAIYLQQIVAIREQK